MGSCYGYSVASERPLSFLRDDVADLPELSIEFSALDLPAGDLEAEWEPIDGQRPATTIHRSGRTFEVTIGPWRWDAHVDERRIVCEDEAGNSGVMETMMWGTAAALQMTADGRLGLHAGSVDLGPCSVLFAGEGKRGKTTLTAAFQTRGHRMLADDLSAVALDDDRLTVLPGPAVLRMRTDAFDGTEMPPGTVSFSNDEKTHLRLDRCGDGFPVPVAAVLLPEWGAEVGLDPVSPQEIIRALWPLTFHMPSKAGIGDSFGRLADLAAAVPAFRLVRPKTYESLADVVDFVVDRFAA